MRSRLIGFSILSLTALAAGCGSGTGAVGRVSGTVKFQGQPLTSGEVVFHCKNGEQVGCHITAQGTYELANVPVGSARIIVKTHPFVPPGLKKSGPGASTAKPPEENSSYIALPARYGDPAKSGLTLDVKPGDQQYEIVLAR
jgi:hypothetical protein